MDDIIDDNIDNNTIKYACCNLWILYHEMLRNDNSIKYINNNEIFNIHSINVKYENIKLFESKKRLIPFSKHILPLPSTKEYLSQVSLI